MEINLTETEKAYLAGIFDGEGCAGVYLMKSPITKYKYHRIYFLITNTDFALAKWISERIPGVKIRSRNRKPDSEWKPIWEWSVKGWKQVKQILDVLRPYLVIKANQVDLVLSLMDDENKVRGKTRNKLSPEVIARRAEVETQLKAPKAASTQFVH